MKRLHIAPGTVFGRWTTVGPHQSSAQGTRWECRCVCGTQRFVEGQTLRKGFSTSCGCVPHAPRLTHGQARRNSRSPLYTTWRSMIQRCSDESNPLYGGRGISVCDRWMSFEAFARDVGPRPIGCSLDRINSNGNYEPSNCRWATANEQGRNTSKNLMVDFRGARMALAAAAEMAGLPYGCVQQRIQKLGWTHERALTAPPRKAAVR